MAQNPIQEENSEKEFPDWQLSNPAMQHIGNPDDGTPYQPAEIEGYASLTSVAQGGNIDFYVNTASKNYKFEIFRMGWYDGAGARLMADAETLAGTRQAIPAAPTDSEGFIECAWAKSKTINIPKEWTSGVYLVRLTTTDTSKQSYIMFVVREDSRDSDVLFQCSVTNYQAYNSWGGRSLYDFTSRGNDRGRRVSFNRPYAANLFYDTDPGVGAGDFLTGGYVQATTPVAGWEYNMVRWLEREGYDVTYATNIDVHQNPKLLQNHKSFLSVGHDEYWSWNMRDNVEAARDKGVSLGFFCSNTCYWQIRLEPDANNVPDRTVVAYKQTAYTEDECATDNDPANDKYITYLWRANNTKPPEDALLGVMYIGDGPPLDEGADLVIASSAPPWILANTKLKPGGHLANMMGFEADRRFSHAPAGTVTIAHADFDAPDPDIAFGTPCMTTLWDLSTLPTDRGRDDGGRPVELGVRFTPTVDGTIQYIRFFKGSKTADSGPFSGHFWDSNGHLLGTTGPNRETIFNAGWKTLKFDQAIPVSAGQTYIASYHSPGNFAIDEKYFAGSHPANTNNTLIPSSGLITAPADSPTAHNGVFMYDSDAPGGNLPAFPTNTFKAANYWVDVVFRPAKATESGDVVSYTTPRGATVFATGSPYWIWALDDYNANGSARKVKPSDDVKQMTRNVLAKFGATVPAQTLAAAPSH